MNEEEERNRRARRTPVLGVIIAKRSGYLVEYTGNRTSYYYDFISRSQWLVLSNRS